MAEELKEEPIFIESIPQYQEFLRVNNMDNTPWRYSVYTIARLPLRKKIYELEQRLADSEKDLKISRANSASLEESRDDYRQKLSEETQRGLALKEKCEIALEVIRFYHDNCRDDLYCDYLGGIPTDKRAREFLEKHDNKPSSAETK